MLMTFFICSSNYFFIVLSGSHQAVVSQSSGSHIVVIRQSSSSHQAVIGQKVKAGKKVSEKGSFSILSFSFLIQVVFFQKKKDHRPYSVQPMRLKGISVLFHGYFLL